MNGVDAILFTGGIGENDMDIRAVSARICGISRRQNFRRTTPDSTGRDERISADDSKLVWVVPTNEELLIARDT